MLIHDLNSKSSRIVYNEFIYVFKCGELYKIGKSKNPEERKNYLQKNTPFEIEIIFIQDVLNMTSVEYHLQEMFKDKRIRGEWFLLNSEDILKIKNADFRFLSGDGLPF